eukprot:1224756-Pleurochrysis_carterae.AAC.1
MTDGSEECAPLPRPALADTAVDRERRRAALGTAEDSERTAFGSKRARVERGAQSTRERRGVTPAASVTAASAPAVSAVVPVPPPRPALDSSPKPAPTT